MRFRKLSIISLIVLLIAISLTGCVKPSYRLIGGLSDDHDLIVLATDAPDNISIYSVNKARIEHTLPSDERLNSMAVDKAGKYAYVVTKNGWLNIFNLQRGDRKDRVRIGDLLQSIALSADGKYLAVGVGKEEDYNAHDISIRPTDNIQQEVIRLNLRGDIQDLVANPVVPELYVINTNADKIRVFNFNQMELSGLITVGGSPSTFTVSPDGKKAFATLNARNTISVIDLTTYSNLIRYDVPGAPHFVAFTKDGTTVAVSDREENMVYFIDNVNDKFLGYKQFPSEIAGGNIKPEILAFSENGKYLYVISNAIRDLLVIDIRTMHMVQNHSLPKRPKEMCVIWGAESSGSNSKPA